MATFGHLLIQTVFMALFFFCMYIWNEWRHRKDTIDNNSVFILAGW